MIDNEKNFKKQSKSKLLLIIIPAVIVIVAAIYFHNHNNASKNQSSPTSSSAAVAQPGYVAIKEWGVSAKYSGGLTLKYVVANPSNNPTHTSQAAVLFNSDQLEAADLNDCTNPADGGYILRYQPTDKVVSPGNENAGTAQEFFRNNPGRAKLINGYYYEFIDILGTCAEDDNPKAIQVEKQTAAAVKIVAQNLKAIPPQQ
jgi:hypothetical protein